MSFPRAKIQRFNDIHNTTPSPADYNPKLKNHVTGAVISTTGRFIEQKSPAHSETASTNSLSNTSCFRTPTLPKKKKIVPKPKCTNLFGISNSEELNEKIVECSNKDTYIDELMEQLEDMRIQINNLKLQKRTLEQEKENFEHFIKSLQEQHKIELENIIKKHSEQEESLAQQISNANVSLELTKQEYGEFKKKENEYNDLIERLKTAHELETQNIQLQINNEQANLVEYITKLSTEIISTKTEWNKFRLENKVDIQDLFKNMNQFQDLNKLLMKTYNEEIKVKETIIEKEKLICGQLTSDLEKMKILHAEEIEALNSKHKAEIIDIEYEMLKTITHMQTNLEEEKKLLETKHRSEITNIKNSHDEILMNVQNQTEAQIKHIQEDCKEANLLTEMQMQEKCKEIETGWKIKFDTQVKYLKDYLKECQELNEFNLTQYKVANDNLKKDFSTKLQETDEKWKLKLEAQVKESGQILAECQEISEYNIIQCEIEKNDLKHKLSEVLKQFEETNILKQKYLSEKNSMETAYNKLKLEYDTVINKLEQTQNDLVNQTKQLKDSMQQTIIEKRTFEVTIDKTRKTVEALTKRLFDSDRDVEQLKSELDICEKSKLDLEDKCNRLTDELDNLKKLNEDLDLQSESTLKVSEEKVQMLEKQLLDKVNEYKKLVQVSVINATQKLEEKTTELSIIKEQFNQQQILNSEAQNLISKVSLQIEQYNNVNSELEMKVSTLSDGLENAKSTIIELEDLNKNLKEQLKDQITCNKKIEAQIKELHSKNEEIESLTKQMTQLQEKSDSYYQYFEYYKCKTHEYEQEVEDMNKIHKKYIDQSGKYDALLQKYEASLIKNKELEEMVMQQELLIGPFREQLEAYEMERSALISQKHDAENEAKIMGLKYAEMLGHQNQKQKIKHLMDLKQKNFELQESKNDMELKIRSQNKAIEKLKKEVSLLTKSPRKPINSDKENINSPNRSLNNSHIPSPLRDRN